MITGIGGSRGAWLNGLASTALVLAGLYVGRALLAPIAASALIGLVLMPSVLKLERLGMRRGAAVGAVMLVAGCLLSVLVWRGTAEFRSVADMLPSYRQNIRVKLKSLGLDRLLHLTDVAIGPPVETPVPGPSTDRGASGDATAVPAQPVTAVRVVETEDAKLKSALEVLWGLLGPLGAMGLAVVIIALLLSSWEEVRERLIAIVSGGRLTLTTRALDEVSQTISIVLRAQLVVNAAFGVVVGLSLWTLGIPNAGLWAVMAVPLRFIPIAGVLMAAAAPTMLAVAVSDGWSLPAAIVGVYLVLELITGNFIEPAVVGSRAGVSTLALLLAAVFWTWIWGFAGLLLSTPITVGLAVVGRHVPQLRTLALLLGSGPALEPASRVYQRLLARDREDLVKLIEDLQRESDLTSMLDRILVPVLRQLENDYQIGVLDEERWAAGLELLDEAVELAINRAGKAEPAGPVSVVCVPASDDADTIGAIMLAAALNEKGIPARSLTRYDLGSDMGLVLRETGATLACISAIPPGARRSAAIRARQVRVRAPELTVMTVEWDGPGVGAEPEAKLPGIVERVSKTLAG